MRLRRRCALTTMAARCFQVCEGNQWSNLTKGNAYTRSERMHDALRKEVALRFRKAVAFAQRNAIELSTRQLNRLLFTVLFETAVKMTDSEDDRISLLSPDAPRVGEPIAHAELPKPATVTKRVLVSRQLTKTVLKVFFEYDSQGSKVLLSAEQEHNRPRPDAEILRLLQMLDKEPLMHTPAAVRPAESDNGRPT